MTDNLKRAIGILKDYRKGDFVDDTDLCEAIDTVVAELEKPTYTPADMEAFAEWCYINAEWIKENEWMLFANDGSGFKVTTTQMRERWEIETGRK